MKRATDDSNITVAVKSERDEGAESKDSAKKPKRSDLTANACTRCRSKKSKCDGSRPVCTRCEKDNATCVFDVGDGLTRMQGLQQQLEKKNVDHDRLMILMNAFQHGSDEVATFLLARLRIGESIENLVCSLERGDEVRAANSQPQPAALDDLQSTHHQLWPDLNPLDPDDQPDPDRMSDRSMGIQDSPPPEDL